MVKYQHIFFDLDRTIWDFEKNSEETIFELLKEFKLLDKGNITDREFIEVYKEINHGLWVDYREGKIDKAKLRAERFYQSLLKFKIDEAEMALDLNNQYVSRCSTKTNLVPHSKEILEYLSHDYVMHIITNGFKEAQYVKLEKSGIRNFFTEVIVSDELGINKPDPRIFHHAMELSSAELDESIMIGDDFDSDIVGAQKVGMDQIYFAPALNELENKKATFTVRHLEELKQIF